MRELKMRIRELIVPLWSPDNDAHDRRARVPGALKQAHAGIRKWTQDSGIVEVWAHIDKDNVDRLEEVLLKHLPEGPALYPEDYLTDQPERFFVAEMVRERILHHTRQEIPYVAGVVVESFKEEEAWSASTR